MVAWRRHDRSPARPLRDHGRDRRRRDGSRLQGHRPEAAAHGGPQAAASRAGGRPRSAEPLRARGARRVGAQPSEHRHRPRDRQRRRRRLHRDGARRGRDARRPDRARPRSGQGARLRGADRRGARGRARRGHRAPRPQASQRDREAGRPGQGAGLRPGQAGGRRPRRHPCGDGERRPRVRGRVRGRNRRVHVAGAGGRQAARRAQRHLLVRHRALRDADRPAAVRRGQRKRRC